MPPIHLHAHPTPIYKLENNLNREVRVFDFNSNFDSAPTLKVEDVDRNILPIIILCIH